MMRTAISPRLAISIFENIRSLTQAFGDSGFRFAGRDLRLDVMSTPHISPSGFDLSPPTAEERKALEAALTREEAEVLLHHGTEAPFCGGLLDQKDSGVYCCRLCGLPLFEHKTKFESGTGW